MSIAWRDWWALGRPRVFAHRGGSALAPENTFAAFDHGLALGADGLELDVHLSLDDVVVVHHDKLLDRTTNLRGLIAARTSAELGRADAGRGCAVPSLAAVLDRYPGVPIIIESKVDTPAMAGALVAVLERARAADRVCVGCFGGRVLRALRRLAPAIATSASREEVRLAVYRTWLHWPMRRTAHPTYSGYQVPEWAGRTHVVTPRFIEYAHRAGRGVQVWTVDTESDARRLLAWGADALITDRPDVVVPLCRSLR